MARRATPCRRAVPLDILTSQGSRRPKIRFLGGYGLAGATNHYYFTDRFLASQTSSVGLFLGVRVVPGTANLQGAWHVLSLHVIFSGSQVLDPGNVGRASAGSLTIDSAGAMSGTGLESTKATLTYGGTARPFEDGRVDLSLTFQDAQRTDTRLIVGGAFHC